MRSTIWDLYFSGESTTARGFSQDSGFKVSSPPMYDDHMYQTKKSKRLWWVGGGGGREGGREGGNETAAK